MLSERIKNAERVLSSLDTDDPELQDRIVKAQELLLAETEESLEIVMREIMLIRQEIAGAITEKSPVYPSDEMVERNFMVSKFPKK